jgi:hypothetical protein
MFTRVSRWWLGLGLDRKNLCRPRQSSFFDNVAILGYTKLAERDCTHRRLGAQPASILFGHRFADWFSAHLIQSESLPLISGLVCHG